MSPPVPVKATDGRWYLAYEVRVENWTGAPVTVEGLRVVTWRTARVEVRVLLPWPAATGS